MHSVVIGHCYISRFQLRETPAQSKESVVGWLRLAIFCNCAWGRHFQFPFVQNLPRVPESQT